MRDNVSRYRPSQRDLILSAAAISAGAAGLRSASHAAQPSTAALPTPLPEGGTAIPVAFLLDDLATIIDFCGPWEVFQDTGGHFDLFTVAPSTQPITVSGGMRIIPQFSLADAPPAKVIVIPAQAGGRQEGATTRAKVEWISERHADAEVVLSICTGAFLLARTGLLDGLNATTHHNYLDDFARDFPRVNLQRHRLRRQRPDRDLGRADVGCRRRLAHRLPISGRRICDVGRDLYGI
jgi:putative intracellular protease/amidase